MSQLLQNFWEGGSTPLLRFLGGRAKAPQHTLRLYDSVFIRGDRCEDIGSIFILLIYMYTGPWLLSASTLLVSGNKIRAIAEKGDSIQGNFAGHGTVQTKSTQVRP